MQVVVGRIGRAHGVAGEVAVDVRTDDPELRFATGVVLATEPPDVGPLTVRRVRWHSGRLLVRFAEVADRTAAQRASGALLVVDSVDAPPLDDPDEFYDHQLVGLAVLAHGATVGEVVDVLHLPGQDVLVVSRGDGREALVPFVRAIVPAVYPGRCIVVAPPPGLLDMDEGEGASAPGPERAGPD